MLKRIYIDNFKCLVNFELAFDSINLFLGPNGAGKSAVFDVLRKIQAFVSGEKATNLFHPDDLTRWQTSPVQHFELEIEVDGNSYKYELVIEHITGGLYEEVGVAREKLWFNKKLLLKFESGKVHLYPGDEPAPSYALYWNQSALATLPPEPHSPIIRFRQWLERFIIVQINPMMMLEHTNRPEDYLNENAANFVSWYRHISQDQGIAMEIITELTKVLDGFKFFKFDQAGGQTYLLKLNFSGEKGKPIDYSFGELSDGQRVLVALYALVYHARSGGYTLCIDEPENFIALREIQPWLILLYDLCSDGELQALLISHHPELIDYLAVSAGYWFDRESNAPVRVKQITEDDTDGGLISELVARGWLHG
ncbi:AAA family ATPase [Candidatus Poribacteria bacterium]|nr:AAA family ATPase [Candidatus Poribacteria bacterium]